ncbi:MAG: hypothetical protein K0S41_1746 [Anaerocolumna sp.]|jgi:hypothetical protein|nr:hypothetical protein [Anaerocolumna sp.]
MAGVLVLTALRGYQVFGELCQKGCHGFSFPLDDSIIDISQDIEVWLDNEVSCLQRKRIGVKNANRR